MRLPTKLGPPTCMNGGEGGEGGGGGGEKVEGGELRGGGARGRGGEEKRAVPNPGGTKSCGQRVLSSLLTDVKDRAGHFYF